MSPSVCRLRGNRAQPCAHLRPGGPGDPHHGPDPRLPVEKVKAADGLTSSLQTGETDKALVGRELREPTAVTALRGGVAGSQGGPCPDPRGAAPDSSSPMLPGPWAALSPPVSPVPPAGRGPAPSSAVLTDGLHSASWEGHSSFWNVSPQLLFQPFMSPHKSCRVLGAHLRPLLLHPVGTQEVSSGAHPSMPPILL